MTFIPSNASMMLSARLEVRQAVGNSPENQSNQSVLQHLYFIIAVFVALLLVGFRIYLLRRKNRPITDFFSIVPSRSYHNESQASGDHAFGSSYQHSRLMPLAPLPSAYRPSRRVNAADTDAAGRRFGEPDDLDWDGKDILPAYNNFDRPPKYNSRVAPTQGYIRPLGTNTGNYSVAVDAEALPVAEPEQLSADITGASHTDRVDPAPPAPRHGFIDATG